MIFKNSPRPHRPAKRYFRNAYSTSSQHTIVSNAKAMIDLFRQEGAFISFVRVKFHDGKDKLNPNAMVQLPEKRPEAAFSDFADELGVTDTDYVVNKRNFSAFFGADLDLSWH
ncbi:isochorismatase family protein yecD [Streptococcus dysgalactiae subsp. dysgalactiae]|uniref:Isochorismatase family protein yecD n=1 Tax=Streptococcus dysgalactiae subsp. dysgalactiae TaxID=99822 RepID=A0A380JR77_STRDY|nr:isochorismatase family protein yecD [Streptococcus dysgalactiae subsp. dysgalactiae]